MNWTDAQVEALEGLIAQGLSAKTIGNELGVSRNAVIGKAHRVGLAFSNKQGPPVPKPVPRNRKPPCKPPRSIALPPEPEHVDPLVTFAELTAHHCRWPMGDNCYCGGLAIAGSSYCRRHTFLAHQHHRVPA